MAADAKPDHKCWKCHKSFPPEVKVCISCGVDLETGEDLARRGIPEPDPEEIDPYRPRNAFQWVMMNLPGLFRPTILVGFFGMAVIFVILEMLALLLLTNQVAMTAMTIGAVGLLAWAQGIIWLLVGRFTLLHEGLTEIRGSQWHLFFLLTFAPIATFMVVLKLNPPADGV
jgi:hypothetical protein